MTAAERAMYSIPVTVHVGHEDPNDYAVDISRKSGLLSGATPTEGGWGNPFVIGKDGDRDTVCQHYRELLWKLIQIGDRDEWLYALDGLGEAKQLVCHCAPKACHGHVLEAAILWARCTLHDRELV